MYLRVSDMDVDPNAKDAESDLQRKIQHQEDWARRESETRGWTVVGVYKERHTGTVSDRPELNRLRAEIKGLGATKILVYSDDRLGRDDLVTRGLITEFERLTPSVEILFGNISLQGMRPPDRKLFISIKTAITAWGRDTIVDRLSRGATSAKARGTFFSELPNHFEQTAEGIIRPTKDAIDMLRRHAAGEAWMEIARAHHTYRRDVQRTVARVRKWNARPQGVEWRRGAKVLRALRDRASVESPD